MGKIERGGEANVFIDQRLEVGKSLILPIKDSIPPEEGPASIALGPDRKLIYTDQDGLEHTVGGDDGAVVTDFKIISPDPDNVIHVSGNGTIRKAIISSDVSLDALTGKPGESGILLIKQDDLGGNLITLAVGNSMTLNGALTLKVPNNTLPRAVTRLTWERYDDSVYWKSEVLTAGIVPTTLPVFAIDDYYNTLEVFHQLPDSEILISENDGPWMPYTGKFSIGAVDRPAGYWKAKIKGLEPTRIESGVAYSLAVLATEYGFPLTLAYQLT